jgi:RNA polymerase-binding transcription factor DksA
MKKKASKKMNTIKKAKKTKKMVKKTIKPLKKKKPVLLKPKKKIISVKTKIKETPKIQASVTPKKLNKKISKFRYTTKELSHFREIIVYERKLILESATANMKALVDTETGEYVGDNLTYATHMAEQGTDEMEREKNYLFVQRDEKYLGYLQEALTRIAQGTYGICIDCIDEPKQLCKTCPLIPKERLELVPITQHCIECKNLRG